VCSKGGVAGVFTLAEAKCIVAGTTYYLWEHNYTFDFTNFKDFPTIWMIDMVRGKCYKKGNCAEYDLVVTDNSTPATPVYYCKTESVKIQSTDIGLTGTLFGILDTVATSLLIDYNLGICWLNGIALGTNDILLDLKMNVCVDTANNKYYHSISKLADTSSGKSAGDMLNMQGDTGDDFILSYLTPH
jgi:hypothetical protein